MNIQKYSLALLTSLEKHKNSTATARELKVNQSQVARFLDQQNNYQSITLELAHQLFGQKKVICATDDFGLRRFFSESTEGTSIIVDQTTKSFTMGTKIVASGLTDGKYFLPLDLEHWVAEFIVESSYLTKPQLAEKLVLRILSLGFEIDYWVLDGLYFTEDFLKFLDDLQLRFVIKSKTTTLIELNGQMMALKNCPKLRLNSNQSTKRIRASWRNRKWTFSAVRRNGKRGPKVIYLVSNFWTKAKRYAQVYDGRWKIEKFIRTGKQSLGLASSMARKANVYLNHIRCVFYAYGMLQLIMKRFKLDSAEAALRKVQALKFKLQESALFDQISLLVNYA